MDNENTYLENYCYYSDLPSPMAYVGEKCMDYDSMGDYSRFPKTKEKKNNIMKRMIKRYYYGGVLLNQKKMINLYGNYE